MNEVSSNDALKALVSNNRSELGKTFGVGFLVSDDLTPEEVISKCNSCIKRYENYINNFKAIIDSGDKLASEMKKAKAMRIISSLDENERGLIKELL